MIRFIIILLLYLEALSFLGCSSRVPGKSDGGDSISVTIWTERLELFMEYPLLRVGEPARFAAHLTDLSDFDPITAGPVLFAFYQDGQLIRSLALDEPLRPGIFVPETVFEQPGRISLEVTVEAADGASINVWPIQVHPAEAKVDAPEETFTIRGDRVSYLKEQQWKLPFRSEPVETHPLQNSFKVSGRVIENPGKGFTVVPPLDGRYLPPPQGLPTLGQAVKANQLLGWIEPPLPAPEHVAIESAQVQTELSLAQLDQRIAEAQAALAQRQSELKLAQQEKDRAARLFRIEAVPEKRIELAQEGLVMAQANLEAARKNVETLAQVKRQVVETRSAGPARHRLSILSPGSGVITESSASPGVFVEGNHPLFKIIDLSEVWVRGELSESRLDDVLRPMGALVHLPGQGLLELNQTNSRLLLIGDVVDPATRTVPLVWQVKNEDRRLKIGMLVSIDVRTGEKRERLAVPRTAVFEEEGRKVVYTQVAGETFDRRLVETGIEEASLIEVLSGLSAGERVVVEGGYAVGLAARSTSETGEGHVH